MNKVIRNFLILPCCLLILNLVNMVISYKAGVIRDGMLRTAFVIVLVLFGSSAVTVVLAPGIGAAVQALRSKSREHGGSMGEVIFLGFLALLVFWLYYRASTLGTASILPPGWRNPTRS